MRTIVASACAISLRYNFENSNFTLGFPIGILLREIGAEWRTMQLQIYATDTRMELNIYVDFKTLKFLVVKLLINNLI